MSANSIQDALDADGYYMLPGYTKGLDEHDAQEAILGLIGRLATPLHIYKQHPFWKPLPADIDRPRNRSGGIGLNSLHMDCVNAEEPPDLIFFHCVRSDPAGGGTTLLCSTRTLADAVPATILKELMRPIYRDGALFDLDGIGRDINPFPIYDPTAKWPWRYTGRILETLDEQDPTIDAAALIEFDRIVMSRAAKIDFHAGDVAIVNQKNALHGRLPMGPNQERWTSGERRLMIQCYGRR